MNNYGNSVELRSSRGSPVGNFVVEDGETKEQIVETEKTDPFAVRVYDQSDGIPIQFNGGMYSYVEPQESPDYVYEIVLKRGKTVLCAHAFKSVLTSCNMLF